MSAIERTFRPIAAGDRVSDVLARDESLVEVFVRAAPPFAKLRKRAMRRVMARLVTVEQAARMAGISTETLLNDLNAALAQSSARTHATAPVDAPERNDSSPAPSGAPAPQSATLEATPASPSEEDGRSHPLHAPVTELDVRDDLRAGREPFSRIMAAVAALRSGEVLLVRATFEPIPLLHVLAKRGFVHETHAHAADDWSVWFWRPGDAAVIARNDPPSPPDPTPASTSGAPIAQADTVQLDVRGLEPPEPLVRTLAALETLPDGHVLVQVNSRVPQFLLPVLAERGFACEIDESHREYVLVRIWRRV
jgi:TusA-related sulfurtransferase